MHSVTVLWKQLILLLFYGFTHKEQSCFQTRLFSFTYKYLCIHIKKGSMQGRTQITVHPVWDTPTGDVGIYQPQCVQHMLCYQRPKRNQQMKTEPQLLAILNTAGQEVHRVCCINREHGLTHLNFYSILCIFHKSEAMEQLYSFLANLFTQISANPFQPALAYSTAECTL